MGCNQTRVESPSKSNIQQNSSTSNYVKGVLKKAPASLRGRTEMLANKRKPSISKKSVLFDENVRVKTRTPTPREASYEKHSTLIENQKSSVIESDLDNDDHDVSSISSQDDSSDESRQFKSLSNSLIQKNSQTNEIKINQNPTSIIQSNEQTISSSTNVSIISLNRTLNQQRDHSSPPPGKHFRILRKSTNETLNQSSNAFFDSNHLRNNSPLDSTVSQTNKTPVVIAHHVETNKNLSTIDDTSAVPVSYYEFSRRSQTKSNKKN